MVLPWKPFFIATIPRLPVNLRAIFIAVSFASAPELQKNTLSIPRGAISTTAFEASALTEEYTTLE